MRQILVVDDESEICDFLKLFFEERGYGVKTANSGEQAITLLDTLKPDVILLDIHMPGMDGLNTLKKIKEKTSDPKVIMVTALETREKIEEAMRLGADNYITKPLSLEYLEKDVKEKVENLSRSTK